MLWIVYRVYCVVSSFVSRCRRSCIHRRPRNDSGYGSVLRACYLFFPKIFAYQPEAHFTAFMIVAIYYKCLHSIEEDIWVYEGQDNGNGED